MCGISGIVLSDTGKVVDAELLKRITDVLSHRGPDDSGYHIKMNAGLGHRRLSIIDIATGKQPILNEDQKVSIVFNGEIYNHHDLRGELIKKGHDFKTKSDTETILHQYEESGKDCVKFFRGMFAFAIWDENKQELFIARDRVGKKPLYYAPITGGIIFASELKALLQHPAIKRDINQAGIHDFLTYQYIPPPFTIFDNIFKLPAAHILIFKNGEIKIEPYWDLDYEPKVSMTEDEALEKTRALIDESVKIRLESEVPLGVLLSGGIDSSSVVAFMRKHITGELKTFSIGFKEEAFNELPFARLVAKKYQTKHEEFIVTPGEFGIIPKLVYHFDEPYGDSSALPTYYVVEMAKKFVTVVLNGDGGDESFCGYTRYIGLPILRRYNKIPKIMRLASKPFFNAISSSLKSNVLLGNLNYLNDISLYPPSLRYLQQMLIFREDLKYSLYSKDFKKRFENRFSLQWALDFFNSSKLRELQDRMMYSDIKTYLAEDLLPKVDRTSMAVSLEGRSPYLDHKLMEFAASLPGCLKFPENKLKGFLKKAVSPLLPPELLTKPKTGFGVPVGLWFRERWREKLKEILLSDKARRRNIFDMKRIASLIDEHAAGRTNHSHRLWCLLMLEIWFMTFIDSSCAPTSPLSFD